MSGRGHGTEGAHLGVPRREVLAAAALGSVAIGLPKVAMGARRALESANWARLPRWRGFNLQEKFQDQPDALSELAPEWSFHNAPFRESDFRLIARWGFNFARLPMSYRCWIKDGDPRRFDEKTLREIDDAVAWGQRYRVHVCLNFHRAPGFCINPPAEPRSLWTDAEAQELCQLHWTTFARRYRGIPSSALSFDLLNEPYNPSDAQYAHVVGLLTRAIHAVDPDRLVIADGNGAGYVPVPALAQYRVAQSTRGYVPKEVTHYQAPWVEEPYRSMTKPPAWPFHSSAGDVWDRARLREMYAPWRALAGSGTGVMLGEFGVYNRTPHAAALGFLDDLLAVMQESGWGWAMWCLRGSMGILDSGRADVRYQDIEGHKLDSAMLALLQRR